MAQAMQVTYWWHSALFVRCRDSTAARSSIFITWPRTHLQPRGDHVFAPYVVDKSFHVLYLLETKSFQYVRVVENEIGIK